jgi:hypothetical protein
MRNDVESWVRTKPKDRLSKWQHNIFWLVKRRKLSMARRDSKNTSDIHKVSPRTKNVFKGRSTNIL